MLTRRSAFAALASAAVAAAQEPDSQPRFGLSGAPRTQPMICGYSGNLAAFSYAEIGDVAREIGYEGIDLTVMIGGHVDPRITNVDLIRAFESIRGSGLEVAMISTNIVSSAERTTYPVLYLTGNSQIPLFRMGCFPSNPGDPTRVVAARNEIAQIASLGERCKIVAMLPNRAGAWVGANPEEAKQVLTGVDPRWAGYYFDPAEAAIAAGSAEGWEPALRSALPRLKAVSLQDVEWRGQGEDRTAMKTPMGQGTIDWPKFFGILAQARFTGPVSLHTDYEAQGPENMAKDVAFTRAGIQKAWGPGLPL
jgi:sugar phosphate isomerase/epimerase